VWRPHRCSNDFTLPFSPSVEAVLRSVLAGEAGEALVSALTCDAELQELTAITSEPGATGQSIHSDDNWSATAPRRLTIFLALHNVVDEAMGPTRFYPGTHAPCCFPGERWLPPTAALAAERQSAWFELRAGDAVLMDSLTWHCGGANASEWRRTLLSASFVAPMAGGTGDDDASLHKLARWLGRSSV